MTNHAKYSPSSSGRWLTCTESMLLPFKENKSSVHSTRGSALHDAAEAILRGEELKESYRGYTPTIEDLEETVVPYMEYVLEIPGELKMIEQKVHITEGCYGTADAICFDQKTGTLHIVDLKAGKGVFVKAKGNTQIQIYALGALKMLIDKGVKNIKKVITHIVQPGINNFQSQEIELYELADLRTLILQTIAKINSGEGVFKSSKEACQFCPHKVDCPELKRIAQKVAMLDFAENDLSEKLSWIPSLKLFMAAVEEESLDNLQQGKPIQGYKLVRGRGNRKWVDLKALESDLVKHVENSDSPPLSEFYTPKKIKSVAQIEKIILNKKIDFDISGYFVKGEGAFKVVEDSEPGEATSSTSEAIKDFKNK